MEENCQESRTGRGRIDGDNRVGGNGRVSGDGRVDGDGRVGGVGRVSWANPMTAILSLFLMARAFVILEFFPELVRILLLFD
jgi:hypothetical protein